MFIDYFHTFELGVVKSTLYFLFQLMTVSEYKVFYKRMSGLEKVCFLIPLMLCIYDTYLCCKSWVPQFLGLTKIISIHSRRNYVAVNWFAWVFFFFFFFVFLLICFLLNFNFHFAEAFFIRVVAPWCFTGLISQACQESLNLLIQIARWLDRGKCSLSNYVILLIFFLRLLYQRRFKGVTGFVPTPP